MIYKIITTQPQIYTSFLETGLIARGIFNKIININIFNLHDFATDKHKTIDDAPYGGGAGMVIKVDVVKKAIDKIKSKNQPSKIILLTPQGKPFKQTDARELSNQKEIIFLSGRFEGYDERIRSLVDREISIGDYILTSGDLPAMVIIEAISRQIPGFIDKEESVEKESFAEVSDGLEYPQYTRPENFQGNKVPEVLLSGNHGEIEKWRREQAKLRTQNRRPDLVDNK